MYLDGQLLQFGFAELLNVFVDEAGDLGFGPSASKMFVVAYAVVGNPHRMRVELQRLRRDLHRHRKLKIEEFKFSRDQEFVRFKVLNTIMGQDLAIGYFVADKRFVSEGLKHDPRRLYNYVVVNNVITNLVQAYDVKQMSFTIDKSLPKSAVEEFNRYLKDKVSWRQVKELGKEMPEVNVSHEDSRNEFCLQTADYCAGVVYNAYEHKNSMHLGILEHKIRFRNSWT